MFEKLLTGEKIHDAPRQPRQREPLLEKNNKAPLKQIYNLMLSFCQHVLFNGFVIYIFYLSLILYSGCEKHVYHSWYNINNIWQGKPSL